jgi:hypothetical protein
MNTKLKQELINLLQECLDKAKSSIAQSDHYNLNGLLMSLAIRNGFENDKDSAEMLFPIMLAKAVLELK